MKHKIYFRADASAMIGYGHFVRTLALANALKEEFYCTFFTTNPTLYQISELEKVCPYVTLQADFSLKRFLDFLQGDEIVVLDNYFYTSDYQKQIKAKGCQLVCIDDRIGIPVYADGIINHIIGVHEKDIHNLIECTKLLGSDYALLRGDFYKAMLEPHSYNPQGNQILVAMGGTDYLNITFKLASALSSKTHYKITVLIGDSYQFANTLSELPVTIYKNLNTEQLIDLIRNQQCVITPPSTLSYEVAAVKCPLVVGAFTKEHVPIAEILDNYNLAVDCGKFQDILDDEIISCVGHAIKYHRIYMDNQEHYFDGNQEKRFVKYFSEIV